MDSFRAKRLKDGGQTGKFKTVHLDEGAYQIIDDQGNSATFDEKGNLIKKQREPTKVDVDSPDPDAEKGPVTSASNTSRSKEEETVYQVGQKMMTKQVDEIEAKVFEEEKVMNDLKGF